MREPGRKTRRIQNQEPIDPPGWGDQELRAAYRNWVQQQEFFQEATEQESVDKAIRGCQEAEIRYRQCLKRIRAHRGF